MDKLSSYYNINKIHKYGIILGLYHNDILISSMSFINHKDYYVIYNYISRYKTDDDIMILQYFYDNYCHNMMIYDNRLWSDKNIFLKFGFKLYKISQPDFVYVKDNIRYNRCTEGRINLLKSPDKTMKQTLREKNEFQLWYAGNNILKNF